MSDIVKIQIIFKETVNIKGQNLPYQDAFYMTQEEYAALKPETLSAMKAERIANWKSAVESVPVEVPLTKEQIQQQIASIEESKVALEAQKVELSAKLVAVEAQVEPLEK
jgi:hypothetical protein